MEGKRIWLLFTSKRAKEEAVSILSDRGYVLAKCGEGFSILKSELDEINRVLSEEGFDLNTKYIQML